MDEEKKEEPKQYTAEDFKREYEELVARTGFVINTMPQFLPRDDNTFSIVVTNTIVKKPVPPQQ